MGKLVTRESPSLSPRVQVGEDCCPSWKMGRGGQKEQTLPHSAFLFCSGLQLIGQGPPMPGRAVCFQC